MNRHGLIVFVKSPGAEGVKSRLARAIGEKQARRFYRCFVLDLLDVVGQGDYELTIFYYPQGGEGAVKEWLGDGRSYEAQIGKDLGERMRRAFERCFAGGCGVAVLIGSDSPDLPAEMIARAFLSLKSRDAVIGPAFDGGYYLIGFKSETFLPEAFSGPSWGTDGVFRDTCAILAGHGRSVSLLPPWHDIDTEEDLKALIARHANTAFAESRTMRCAKSRQGRAF